MINKKLSIILSLTALLIILSTVTYAENTLKIALLIDKESNKLEIRGISVLNYDIQSHDIESIAPNNEYSIGIYSKSGELISIKRFTPIFLDINTMNKINFIKTFRFPYSNEIKSIRIYRLEELILSSDIFSAVCEIDNICSQNENHASCPEDCPEFGEDGLCNSRYLDFICDPDCTFDTEEQSDCTLPNCNDNIQNQDETAVDAGGICNIIHCNDNLRNYGEEGTDCGGICPNPCTESPITVEDILLDIINWLKGEISIGAVFGSIAW